MWLGVNRTVQFAAGCRRGVSNSSVEAAVRAGASSVLVGVAVLSLEGGSATCQHSCLHSSVVGVSNGLAVWSLLNVWAIAKEEKEAESSACRATVVALASSICVEPPTVVSTALAFHLNKPHCPPSYRVSP